MYVLLSNILKIIRVVDIVSHIHVTTRITCSLTHRLWK